MELVEVHKTLKTETDATRKPSQQQKRNGGNGGSDQAEVARKASSTTTGSNNTTPSLKSSLGSTTTTSTSSPSKSALRNSTSKTKSTSSSRSSAAKRSSRKREGRRKSVTRVLNNLGIANPTDEESDSESSYPSSSDSEGDSTDGFDSDEGYVYDSFIDESRNLASTLSLSSSTSGIGQAENAAATSSLGLTEEDLIKRRGERLRSLLRLYKSQFYRLSDALRKKHDRFIRKKERLLAMREAAKQAEESESQTNGERSKRGPGEGSNSSTSVGVCAVAECGTRCIFPTKFCFSHILRDENQKLFVGCKYQNDGKLCNYPIIKTQRPPYCMGHIDICSAAVKKEGRPRKREFDDDSAPAPDTEDQPLKKTIRKRRKSNNPQSPPLASPPLTPNPSSTTIPVSPSTPKASTATTASPKPAPPTTTATTTTPLAPPSLKKNSNPLIKSSPTVAPKVAAPPSNPPQASNALSTDSPSSILSRGAPLTSYLATSAITQPVLSQTVLPSKARPPAATVSTSSNPTPAVAARPLPSPATTTPSEASPPSSSTASTPTNKS